MMKNLNLYTSQQDVDTIIDMMDAEKRNTQSLGDGKIDWEEFCEAMSKLIDAHNDPEIEIILPQFQLDRLQQVQMKVGFGGTTWRTVEDSTWILTNCGVIGVSSLFMAAVIYFRFMLVPMTMAYFLTFVLGPIIDFMSQRPLVCLGKVYCKIKKLPHDQAKMAWKKDKLSVDGRRPLPHVTDIEYPYDASVGRCGHSVPASASAGVIADLFTVGQLPFPFALLMMFVFVATTLYTVIEFVRRDINLVLADPIFVISLKDVIDGLLLYLQNVRK